MDQENDKKLADYMKSTQVNQPPLTNGSAATVSTPLEFGIATVEAQATPAQSPMSKLIEMYESKDYQSLKNGLAQKNRGLENLLKCSEKTLTIVFN